MDTCTPELMPEWPDDTTILELYRNTYRRLRTLRKEHNELIRAYMSLKEENNALRAACGASQIESFDHLILDSRGENNP